MVLFYSVAIFSLQTFPWEKKHTHTQIHTLFTLVMVVLASSLAVTLGASLGLGCLDTLQATGTHPAPGEAAAASFVSGIRLAIKPIKPKLPGGLSQCSCNHCRV